MTRGGECGKVNKLFAGRLAAGTEAKKFEKSRKKFLTNALVSGILNKLSARTATIKAFDKKLKTLKKVLDNVKHLW